jgi:hypothetical protein
MASHTEQIADRQRKQKIILIVGGVLLAAVAGLQAPKLLKRSSSSSPAASSTTPAPTASATTPAATTPAATTPAATSPYPATGNTGIPVASPGSLAGRPTAEIAGVTVGGSAPPAAGEGQLRMFTLFDVKDPFVQQVNPNEDVAPPTTPTATKGEETPAKPAAPTVTPTAPPTTATQPPATATQPPATPTQPSAPATQPSTPAPAKPAPAPKPVIPPPTYATITVNDEPEPLQVKSVFPQTEPLFVLVSLKRTSVEIGIAHGELAQGKTLTLDFGRPVTLVNTATGARYVLELVYTGTAPEEIQKFTSSGSSAAAKGVTVSAPETPAP